MFRITSRHFSTGSDFAHLSYLSTYTVHSFDEIQSNLHLSVSVYLLSEVKRNIMFKYKHTIEGLIMKT